MQNQVWPNIIIYFPIEYWVNIAYTSQWRDQALRRRLAQCQRSRTSRSPTTRLSGTNIAREIGNYMYDNHVSMPLFWFPHTITVNPEVVADWVYPGNTVPRLCCAAYAKAAR